MLPSHLILSSLFPAPITGDDQNYINIIFYTAIIFQGYINKHATTWHHHMLLSTSSLQSIDRSCYMTACRLIYKLWHVMAVFFYVEFPSVYYIATILPNG
jgi:hypothetical protein